MLKSKSIGEGVFIRIPPAQESLFWSILEDAGYERNGDGIVKYILESEDELDESDFEDDNNELKIDPASILAQWASEHPEEWQDLKQKGSQKIGNLLNWIRKKI